MLLVIALIKIITKGKSPDQECNYQDSTENNTYQGHDTHNSKIQLQLGK